MDDFEKLIQSTSRPVGQEPAETQTPRYPPSATGVSPQGAAPNIQAQQFSRPTTPGALAAPVPADASGSGLSIAPNTEFDPAAFDRLVKETSRGGDGGIFEGLREIGYGMSEGAAETGLPYGGMLAGALRGAPGARQAWPSEREPAFLLDISRAKA